MRNHSSARGGVTRRAALLGTAAAFLALTVAQPRAGESAGPAAQHPPIVFVHGNGDSKAVWITSLWRFETNGYPRSRLFAIDLRNPGATLDYQVPQPGLSTAEDVKDQLAAFVKLVLKETGAKKVVLVGNSRGANTIRNYVKNGGGAAVTSKVVLGGGVNHGALRSATIIPRSEFNGLGPFIQQLNAGPNEVVPGVKFLTLRSNRFDKYAQPGPTGVGYDGPALDGATNLVLPGVDHRETSFSPESFARTYAFITGETPRTRSIAAERTAALSGEVTGVVAGNYTNIGVKGAGLEIYALKPKTGERRGGPVYAITTKAGGHWGPFAADPETYYEFVVTVPGQPVTHIYRSPFPRSSSLVTLRPALATDASATESTVTMVRPRGYFGIQDKVLLDGKKPAEIPDDPVPTVAQATLHLPPEPQRAVPTRFEAERITARNWPAGEVAFAELTY